jgi:hypothetical protein
MELIIKDLNKICEYQKIERRLFSLDNFSYNQTAFSKQVFNKHFDKIFFLEFNGWFNSEEDFTKLISFVKESGSRSFIASCPPFYLLNAISVPVTSSRRDYVDNHTYSIIQEEKNRGVGIRKSPEAFYYDESEKWAMVSDLTNNIIIAGLDISLVKVFETVFEGQFQDINEFVKTLEEVRNVKIVDRRELLERFS